MRTSRLEAFSDGVLAIIITIMVLELKPPAGHQLNDLGGPTGTGLLTYLLSFVYVGIYWNNHHHMFHLVERIRGGVLWANLALLFCLSLLPFTTSWMDESRFEPIPVTMYGVNLLLAGFAYYLLQSVIIRLQGNDSPLRKALGRDIKGRMSPVIYITGILSALLIREPRHLGVSIAIACFVAAAVMWVVPDPRIDRAINEDHVARPDDLKRAPGGQ